MCQNNVGVTEVQRLYKVALQRKLENEEEQKFKEEIKVSHWMSIFRLLIGYLEWTKNVGYDWSVGWDAAAISWVQPNDYSWNLDDYT